MTAIYLKLNKHQSSIKQKITPHKNTYIQTKKKTKIIEINKTWDVIFTIFIYIYDFPTFQIPITPSIINNISLKNIYPQKTYRTTIHCKTSNKQQLQAA